MKRYWDIRKRLIVIIIEMEIMEKIKYPEQYKPEKQDIIQNYATVSQIYAHPVSPTIVTLVKDLKGNKARRQS